MESSEDLPESDPTFNVGYETQAGKPTFAVGGAFCSATPDNTGVIAHLFVEYWPLPMIVRHEKETTDGVTSVDLSHHVEEIKSYDVMREVQATLMMSPEVAKKVAHLLNRFADQALEQRKGGN